MQNRWSSKTNRLRIIYTFNLENCLVSYKVYRLFDTPFLLYKNFVIYIYNTYLAIVYE